MHNPGKLLWTDMHSNMHSEHMDHLDAWYNHAKEVIDFWQIAYYPYHMRPEKNGFSVEDLIPAEQYKAQWETLRAFTKSKNALGGLPLFMGFEWQGAGEDGDHNVFYLDNDQEIHMPLRYAELLKKLPAGRAIAIPHHLAYQLGHRGKNWSTHSETFSPFAEIYSSHGSSESGYTDLHMMRHIHMGPRAGGTSVFNGIKLGKTVGVICSGDNHVVPAMYGHGLMGCYAEDCTKEAIWDALLKRHVYGVTGNKIELAYAAGGAFMGDILTNAPAVLQHNIHVRAGDAVHRVELLKNTIVCADYTHAGKWENLPLPKKITFKFKAEFGWGPDNRIYPDITVKHWEGSLQTSGEILSVEKCWTNFGQTLTLKGKNACDFTLTTHKSTQSGKWMGPSPVTTEGFIFEICADIDSSLILTVDGKRFEVPVREILEDTKLIAFYEEAKALAKKRFDFDDYYRSDPFWHNAYKVRLMRAAPQSAYNLDVAFETSGHRQGDSYMVKVYQRDGNVAWSSPIFIR